MCLPRCFCAPRGSTLDVFLSPFNLQLEFARKELWDDLLHRRDRGFSEKVTQRDEMSGLMRAALCGVSICELRKRTHFFSLSLPWKENIHVEKENQQHVCDKWKQQHKTRRDNEQSGSDPCLCWPEPPEVRPFSRTSQLLNSIFSVLKCFFRWWLCSSISCFLISVWIAVSFKTTPGKSALSFEFLPHRQNIYWFTVCYGTSFKVSPWYPFKL